MQGNDCKILLVILSILHGTKGQINKALLTQDVSQILFLTKSLLLDEQETIVQTQYLGYMLTQQIFVNRSWRQIHETLLSQIYPKYCILTEVYCSNNNSMLLSILLLFVVVVVVIVKKEYLRHILSSEGFLNVAPGAINSYVGPSKLMSKYFLSESFKTLAKTHHFNV